MVPKVALHPKHALQWVEDILYFRQACDHENCSFAPSLTPSDSSHISEHQDERRDQMAKVGGGGSSGGGERWNGMVEVD